MLKTHLPFVESMRTGILRSGKPRPRTPSYWGAPPRLGSPRHTSPKTRSTYPLPACPREKTRRPEERKEVTAELGFGIHELHLGRPAEAGRPSSTRCGRRLRFKGTTDHTVRGVSRRSNRHAPGFPEAQYAFKILMIH